MSIINIMMKGLFTISKWELRRTRSTINPKIRIFSIFILILIGTASFFAVQSGLHINDNLYKVVVTDDSIASVIGSDSKFEVYVEDEERARYLFEHDNFDLLIVGKRIYYQNNEKSISAYDSLDKAVKRYNEASLMTFNDLNNTFPVWITIENLVREQSFISTSVNKLPEMGASLEDQSSPGSQSDQVSATQIAGTPVAGIGTTDNARVPTLEEISGGDQLSPISEQTLSTPSHLSPPIPFKSVVLSFLFIFPIYFIAQFFSSSIMEERIKRKGELLLVSPVSPTQIVLGKLIPYLLGSILLVALMTFRLGGSPWIILVVLPICLMYLSTSFLGAIIARSYKELSFVLIFLSVFLSGYIFFPAMFSNVHAVSIISPMTLVVRLLENETVTISDYMFSTIPFYLVSILIFIFGIFIYREEDLFTQKTISGKLLDSIQEFIKRAPVPLFSLSIVLIPIAFSIQMMLIVLMFNFPIRIGIVFFIVVAAFIEELVKSVGIYAVFSRKMSDATTGNALKFGILSGLGFFAGEKLLLLVVIASISSSAFGSAMGAGLLIYPLLLHVTSTTVAALGIRYSKCRYYFASVILASVVHAAYNLYLVRGVILG
jgi:ABC-type Na+ efflux pump permease subunit